MRVAQFLILLATTHAVHSIAGTPTYFSLSENADLNQKLTCIDRIDEKSRNAFTEFLSYVMKRDIVFQKTCLYQI